MSRSVQVLVISSDDSCRQSLTSVLAECGVDWDFARNSSEAFEKLHKGTARLAFCEAQLSDGSFRDVLASSSVPVVVTSRLDDMKGYLEAMGNGAFDFLARPYRRCDVAWVVSKAINSSSGIPPAPAPFGRRAWHASAHERKIA